MGPCAGLSVLIRFNQPAGSGDFECLLNDLKLREYAPRLSAAAGERGLRASGFGYEQKKRDLRSLR